MTYSRYILISCLLVFGFAGGGVAETLHEAAEGGDAERVQELIDSGLPVDHVEFFGNTALHRAADEGHLAVAKVLLANGAEVDKRTLQGGLTALHIAAYRGHLDLVEFLIKNGADPNAQDPAGMTPLRLASIKLAFGEKEFIAIMELLRRHGAE